MKFLTPVSLFLSATAALAIEPRQAPETVYVTVSTLQCTPHGTTCYYTFEVRSSPESAPLICSSSTQAYGTIPSVPNEPCADPNVSFSYVQAGAGKPASLGFTWTSEWSRGVQKIHASTIFGGGDFYANPQDTSQAQRYVGPSNFTISGLTTSLVIRQ